MSVCLPAIIAQGRGEYILVVPGLCTTRWVKVAFLMDGDVDGESVGVVCALAFADCLSDIWVDDDELENTDQRGRVQEHEWFEERGFA